MTGTLRSEFEQSYGKNCAKTTKSQDGTSSTRRALKKRAKGDVSEWVWFRKLQIAFSVAKVPILSSKYRHTVRCEHKLNDEVKAALARVLRAIEKNRPDVTEIPVTNCFEWFVYSSICRFCTHSQHCFCTIWKRRTPTVVQCTLSSAVITRSCKQTLLCTRADVQWCCWWRNTR